MAKSKTTKKKAGGPYLAAAFFCESTIEDKKDGAISAIRIIDQMEVAIDPAAPPDFPSDEPLFVESDFFSGDADFSEPELVLEPEPSELFFEPPSPEGFDRLSVE